MSGHTPPTDEQLVAIEARLNAATAGTWLATRNGNTPVVCVNRTAPKAIKQSSILWTGDSASDADAEFTAHAPDDVRALVAEVRRLRAEVAGPNAEMLRTAGWTECSPQWLAAYPGQCSTAARIPGGTAVSHWHPQQPEQPRLASYQTYPVCRAGYETGTDCSTCAFNARMAIETQQPIHPRTIRYSSPAGATPLSNRDHDEVDPPS
ncbi:hypothetical protein [Streptomyces sp. NPDC002758]